MLHSMTGYGKSAMTSNGKTLKAEIRSLNSKFLDLNLRVPFPFKEKEIEIRNLVTEKVQRGKVDVFITSENGPLEKDISLNKELLKRYYQEFKSVAKELGADKKNLLQLALQVPEVMSSEKNVMTEEEGILLLNVMREAINDLVSFRAREGAGLEEIFKANISAILTLLQQVEVHEPQRLESIKSRLRNQLTELVSSEEYDRNRFEQELIYYLERMDFTEEKVRLRSHCEFFMKTLADQDSNGRRLNFIAQEMGREINTLGAKANHADIQKSVVQMKDELEKIKEQLLNVL
jgi:uncharacterized protein (TIGR00255 family)